MNECSGSLEEGRKHKIQKKFNLEVLTKMKLVMPPQ